MKFLFLLALCIAVGHAGVAELPYTLRQMDSNPGMMIDPVATVVYSDKQWRIVAYIDLKKYEEKVGIVTKSYKTVEALCNVKGCEMYKRMDFLYKSVLEKSLKLKDMTMSTHDDHPHTIAGLPHKTASTKTIELITKYEQSQGYQGELHKEQTYVNKVVIVDEKDVQSKLDRLEKLYEKNIKLNIASDSEKITKDRKVMQNIDDHVQAISLACLDLDKLYGSLIESLNYGQNNVMHPDIMTGQEFMNHLSKTVPNLPTHYKYPYPLDMEHSHDLMHLSEMNIFHYQNKLVYVLNMPLIEETEYTMYDMMPLPIEVSENTYVYIEPSAEKIAVSEDKQKYATMDVSRYCRNLARGKMMCMQVPVYSTESRPICEMELIKGSRTIPSSCNTRLVVNKLDIVRKMHHPNTWMFVQSKPVDVVVKCSSPSTTTHTVKLTKSGLLTLQPNCVAKTPSMELVAERPVSIHHPSPFHANIRTDDCCVKSKLMEIITKIGKSTLHISNINLHNIDSISYKIM